MTEYVKKSDVLTALYMADAITVKGIEILNAMPAEDVIPQYAKNASNGDRIRAMSDEELANCLLCKRSVPHCPPIDMTKYAPCDDVEDCSVCWLTWLKKEVDE